MKKWLILGAVFSWIAISSLSAQHKSLTGQYMFNGLILNPAYAGSKGCLHGSFLFRKQWVGLPGAPQTETFSLHAPTNNLKHNYGATFQSDQFGPVLSNTLSGVYAYRLHFGESSLAFGLQGGLSMVNVRMSQLGRTDEGDPLLNGNTPTILVPQTGAGIYFTHPRYYVGFSVPELLRYRSSDYDNYLGIISPYRHYYFTTGFLISSGASIKIKPSLLVRYMQTVPMQFDLNTNVIIKDRVWIGASYRLGDGVVGMLEVQVNDQLRLGYAFEQSLNALRGNQYGSHELVVNYAFKYKVKTPGIRYF